MLRNVLVIIGMKVLLGLVGHYDYESEVMTHKQDEINKQEVIKDLQLRCYTDDLSGDICKGL